MSDVTVTSPDDLVKEAKGWSAALLAKVHQGPGDTLEASMYRAEAKYAIPAQAFWSLRYDRLKDISAFLYLKFKAAYEFECQRQEAKLRHELLLTKEMLGDAAAQNKVVAEVEAALGAAEGKMEAAE